MPRPVAVVLLALLAAVGYGMASALAPDGAWLCLPLALLVAATAPTVPAGLAGGAMLLAAAAAGDPGTAALLALGAPASLAILIGTRARLERERDAARSSALRDPLTGLANRRALDERMAYEMARHQRRGEPFAVVALDLDGFKAVNDRFGHEAGDELLRDVAAALVGAVRAQDTVARLGGDEFCILAPQTGRAGAAHLIARTEAALSRTTAALEGVSACAGAAVFPADGHGPPDLLAAADTQVLEAKRRLYGGTRRRRAA